MTNMILHDFEDHLLRSFEREDGEFCFIAKDVCNCLEVKQAEGALRKLDDDEKGAKSFSTLGGIQEVLYVTEGGLYTVILRSQKAVTPGTVQHRFRKWVTGEVLPSLRKTGHYDVDPPTVPPAESEICETSLKLSLVREARLTFGQEMAKAMWHEVGLPYIEPPKPEMDDHPVNQFLAECTMPARGNAVASADLRAAYEDWAKANGKPAFNMTVIGRRVRAYGIDKTVPSGQRNYFYTDIALIWGGKQ
ncbi:MAG: BRO family protein [Cohaesibacter sp.]|nr:BRO family protein [Cohaesibacter sp.]